MAKPFHLSLDLYRNIFLAGDDIGDANPRPAPSPPGPPAPLSGDVGAATPSSSARSSWWYRTLPSCHGAVLQGKQQSITAAHECSVSRLRHCLLELTLLRTARGRRLGRSCRKQLAGCQNIIY